MLIQRLRSRISRAGYTPSDLSKLFHMLDEDESGSLTFEEFKAFLPTMNINMSDTVAMRVFETLDDNGQSCVGVSGRTTVLEVRTGRVFVA